MARGSRSTPTTTQAQAQAINLFVANLLGGKNKTVEQILLEAGYDHESARQQTNVMAGIKPHLLDTVEWMKKHRMAVQAQMELKIDDATYDELRKSMDALSYNIQL